MTQNFDLDRCVGDMLIIVAISINIIAAACSVKLPTNSPQEAAGFQLLLLLLLGYIMLF